MQNIIMHRTWHAWIAVCVGAACTVHAAQPADPAPSVEGTKLLAVEARSSTPKTYVLSRDHVNLVRIKGAKITDAVYDAQALEVSADKARGIVFIRVRKAWLEKGQDVTSAFFNTDNENHSVRFVVSSVPSQTVDLEEARHSVNAEDVVARELALARPLMKFSDADYITELKHLVREAHRVSTGLPLSGTATPTLGMLKTEGTDQEKTVPIAVSDERIPWRGMGVRTTGAFLTRDKLVETLVITNLQPRVQNVDVASLAKTATGTLAVAVEKTRLKTAERTLCIVIRSRALAVMGSEAGLVLTGALLADASQGSER